MLVLSVGAFLLRAHRVVCIRLKHLGQDLLLVFSVVVVQLRSQLSLSRTQNGPLLRALRRQKFSSSYRNALFVHAVRVDELGGVVHSEIEDLSLRVEFGVGESFAHVLGTRFVVLDSWLNFELGVGSLCPLVAR